MTVIATKSLSFILALCSISFISDPNSEIVCYKTLEGRVHLNFSLLSNNRYKCKADIESVGLEDSGAWRMEMVGEKYEVDGSKSEDFIISIKEVEPKPGSIEADPEIPVNRGMEHTSNTCIM